MSSSGILDSFMLCSIPHSKMATYCLASILGFLEGISHSMRTDRSINDGIDVLSGMNSILDLANNNLLNNSHFIDRSKLQRMATMKSSLLWLEFLKNLAYCRLP